DVDQIGRTVAVHIANQEALWVKADPGEEDGVFEARTVAHGDASPPAAVAPVGPILNATVMDQENVLQAVAGQVPELDAWSSNVTSGKEALSARSRTSRSDQPSLGSL